MAQGYGRRGGSKSVCRGCLCLIGCALHQRLRTERCYGIRNSYELSQDASSVVRRPSLGFPRPPLARKNGPMRFSASEDPVPALSYPLSSQPDNGAATSSSPSLLLLPDCHWDRNNAAVPDYRSL